MSQFPFSKLNVFSFFSFFKTCKQSRFSHNGCNSFPVYEMSHTSIDNRHLTGVICKMFSIGQQIERNRVKELANVCNLQCTRNMLYALLVEVTQFVWESAALFCHFKQLFSHVNMKSCMTERFQAAHTSQTFVSQLNCVAYYNIFAYKFLNVLIGLVGLQDISQFVHTVCETHFWACYWLDIFSLLSNCRSLVGGCSCSLIICPIITVWKLSCHCKFGFSINMKTTNDCFYYTSCGFHTLVCSSHVLV